MAALEHTRLELAGEYERVQKKAFTNWVNSHLIKVGQKINDLYEDFRDGNKLLLLLELLCDVKLRREKGKMRVHKLQNVQTALNFLQKDRKIKLVNMQNESLVDGNSKLTLGLVWTLILHFQISGTLSQAQEGERPISPQEISAKVLKEQLMEWAQNATEGYEEVQVKNFHTSWRDGLAFCAILDRHRPDLLNYDDCDPDRPMENLEKAFKVAEEELGIIRIVDPEDICVSKPDEKAVMTYVSFLRHAFPTMPPPHRKKVPAVSLDDYQQLYEATKQWIDEKTQLAKSRDFPTNVTDMKARMADFHKLKSQEVPVKQRDVVTLADLHDKLQAQRKKKSSSPAIPSELEYPLLEADWTCLLNELDASEKAMQEELERLEKLQTLADKILAECDNHDNTLDQLEESVCQFESSCTSLPPEEATRQVEELKKEIKSVEIPVRELSSGVKELREGCYHDVKAVQQRVNSLSSRLHSLSPRLEGASSAVGEARAVIAMETNLEELEVWLVSCGRFSNNQQILLQIDDHKSFQLDQLSTAEENMARINHTPPPPGLEEKVSEVNKRWEQVVKQTKDRIAGLEPIVETVCGFNVVKNPLEDWCTQQQEYFEHLPPLEVTEEQLREQEKEFEAVRADIAAHREPSEKIEELAQRFLREMEPVQSLADRYARKLKSRDKVAKKTKSSEEEPEASFGEQAGILQGQWEWLMSQATARTNQISDLLANLGQFNQQYNTLREFVKEGNDLLGNERPVGSSAARIREQMEICQNFRAQITSKQPDVDAMLSLGRAIIAEPNTNPQNDTIMKKLTNFIEDWSELQLAWQNWYNELHANLEQSKNLSDRLNTFGHGIKGLEPACDSLFPATVAMESLDTELQELQSKFTTEVLHPYEEQKATYTSLKASAALLPDPSAAQETFSKFEAISNTVESYKQELAEVVLDVSGWWGGCVGVKKWTGGVEGRLVEQRPLAGSVDIVEEQRSSAQDISVDIEAHKSEVEGALRSLTSLSSHEKLLYPSPVTSYCERLRTCWEDLCQEAETRKELTSVGKQHLSTYAGQSVPFAVWLCGAEDRLRNLGPLPRSKERLFSCVEEFQTFTSDVESHGTELDEVEKLGSQFLGCAKPYQSQLLDYRRKIPPDESGQLPDCFVDLESGDLGLLSGEAPQFEGSNYENGIKVVSGDSTFLRKRYDALLAGVRQQRKLLEEAKQRREEFDSTLGELLPELSGLEERCEGVRGEGSSQPETIQEQVEIVQALEVECLALDPKLQAVQSAYGIWEELGKEGGGVWEGDGEDDARGEKEAVEQRYASLLDRIRDQKGMLDSELSDAHAFHDAFGDFIAWLRDTERKIQRDDPLKLEVAELKKGLTYLQGIAGDIQAHERVYEELCSKCRELVGRGMHDGEELQQKLDKLQQRWNTLQIVNDDIEAIEETLPKLEAFYASYNGISTPVDDLHDQLDRVSTSAISSEAVENKIKALQELVGKVGVQRSEFEELLASCDLLETPFDQSQFECDVSKLQTRMADCDKLASDKKTQLKALDRKIRPMEDLFREFRAWLGATEEKLGGLSPPARESREREQQLQEAKVIIEDVRDHRESLDSLESAVSDVLMLVTEEDQRGLSHQLGEVTWHYNHLMFDSSCYPVDRWLEDRSSELSAMAPSGVLVVSLQEQVREVQEFQRTVDSYKPELETIATMATQCRRTEPAETDQSGESSADSKVADMQCHYDNLKSLAVERHGVLSSFVPTVQQYESSQGAWSTLLCGWEEKAAMLPPPGAKTNTIQEQIEEIKGLQQTIADHEPEFTSLKREAQKLCEGPPNEAEYLTRVSQDKEVVSGQVETRPGQEQLEGTISDFDHRLEALKKKLRADSEDLNSQLDKATRFQDNLTKLLAWVTEAEGELDGLKIRDPQSTAIERQQQKCQALLQQLASQTPEKDSLGPLLTILTSHLPTENPDREGLQNHFDKLISRFLNLADQLGQCHANLDSALALAKTYEGSTEKLLPWVPDTLSQLENLGPPPADPEAVEKMKSEIEGLKSEYNTLAPVYGTCSENGQSLAEQCEDTPARADLEARLGKLQSEWERLGQQFGEVLQKISDALVQTQKFQTVANGLSRWVDGMQGGIGHQERIAARVRLIEVQIEGFKPILNDISAYSGTMDQAKTMGNALIGESDPEERHKIQARIEALTSQFAALDTSAQTRMTSLEGALQKATVYEDQSNQFDKWLHGVEAKLSSWEPFSIASQPLKRQLEAIKQFTQEVESYKPTLDKLTKSEESLFTSDFPTIQLCEHHILKHKPTPDSSADPAQQYIESSVDKQVIPDWLERPGAPEAIEVGADLRGRYDKLKLDSGVKSDKASQLLEQVESYESEYKKFSDWLGEEKATMGSFSPPAVTLEELKTQLQQVEDLQQDFKNREDSLESINTKGTALVDGCLDELSRDSGRIKISDLNDVWGNALSELSGREEKLKEGIALAEKYMGLHDAFDSWLGGCEGKLAQPVKIQGNPMDITKQLEELKALSSEIAAHQPQLRETVAAGHNLEGYTDAEKTSLPDIGYTDLEDRYNAAKLSVGDHVSQLGGVLDQVSDILDTLRALLDTLEGWRSKLKGHEPPHVLPKDVEAQLQKLSSLEQSVGELQPSIAQAQAKGGAFSVQEETSFLAEGDIPSGAAIYQLLSSIAKGNSEVKELLSFWKDLLSAGLDTAKTFDNDYNSLDTWIKAMEEGITRAEAVRGVPEEVQKQLEQLEKLQSDISSRQSSLTSLTSLGHTMMDNASPEDSVTIGSRLAHITAAFEALQKSAAARRRLLEYGLKQASEFASAWDSIMVAIAGKSEELQQLATVGVDIDTVRSQLDDYKEFESSVSELKPRMVAVLSQGKRLKDSCSAKDSPLISNKLERLNSAWSNLYSDSLSRKHQLEEALLQLGQFHDALAELLTWLAGSMTRLASSPPPGVQPDNVEAQIQELESVESGIYSHTPRVASLNTAGEELINASSTENTAEVQEDLKDLNDKWEALKDLATTRRSILVAALEKAEHFHDNWKQQVDWLADAEKKAYAEWKPCALPETCEAEITKHQAFTEEVQSHREPIDALKSEAAGLKTQGSSDEGRMVERWVSDVVGRWEDLNGALEERQVQLQQAKERADEFAQSYESLHAGLGGMEEAQEKEEPIHSEVEVVKQQLEAHKDHLKMLAGLEAQLDDLDGLGQLLSKECVKADGEVIQQRIADLRARWDLLHSAAIARQSSLEESLLSLGQFEEAYDELWAWLTDALRQLGDMEPITGDPDAVAAQLSKHKALQKQLGAHLSSKNAITKAGKILMKQKTGEDRVVLKKKLQDLEREWEEVCRVSVERQDRLEQAYRHIGQFRSHLGPLRSWMAKVLPMLDDSEPVHGDIDTTDDLMSAHSSFQRELGSHQKSIDAANTSGEHLINEILDDPSVTQQDLQEMNKMWDNICQKSTDKQERLDAAYKAAREFEEGYVDMMLWMDAQCEELQMQSPPDEDASALQQQIEEHKAFSHEVTAKQPEYDTILADGQNLLQLAHPKAVPVLQTKLQNLEQRWLDLRGRIGARSEALASTLLELHGLQDMLGSLWEWVAEAEGRMTETEATPIGEDLETIEQQLADHEAFQEDMATQQPNMDALNKVAKKRKAANPHANPEMTKKISSLYKRWQKLWLRSSERHRQLLEARTRLKDIALARSFNFDAWRKRFLSWVDQQKLRVTDLFRRFDSNHDGMLTRDELMKGLKASGLAMTQIELEKIADTFDRNRDGMIDLNEIMTVVKGTRRTRPVYGRSMSDAEKIDHEIHHQVSKCSCSKRFKVTRVADGQYRFGDSQKLRLVRILRSTVMVRVGGGWEPLEEFLQKHDPCRASTRTNAALRSMLAGRAAPGLTTAGFTTKKQTAIATHNAAMKREASKDPSATVTTRTLPSGRKETTITTKKPSPVVSRESTPTRTEPIKHTLLRQPTGGIAPTKPIQERQTTKTAGSPRRVASPTPATGTGTHSASGGAPLRKGAGPKGSRLPTPVRSTSKSRIPTRQSSDKLI